MKNERCKMDRFSLALYSRIRACSNGRTSKTMELITSSDCVCAAGAFFKTADPLPIGTRVFLNLVLEVPRDGGQPPRRLTDIQVSGRVVRLEYSGMAIKFENNYQMKPLVVQGARR